jgi:glycosyltransferase 2 family protein
MVDNSGKILDKVKPSRIVFPLLIGVAITIYLLRDFDFKSLSMLEMSLASVGFLGVAFVLMVIRDAGYVWRLRLLSGNSLSWRKCIQVVLLWEFTSAITPSAVGGTSVAIFYLNKEGVSLGLGSAMVLMTSLLDELYFIIAFPLVFLLMGHSGLFAFGGSDQSGAALFSNHFFIMALLGYGLKFLYTLVVFYGLFINPRGLKWLLLMIFKLPIIRKWRPQANESGEDLLKASQEFKNWPVKKWAQAFLATALSWTARYWVVNALIVFLFGGFALGLQAHLVVFGKQLVMWIMMLVTPTPGGSGFAEYIFNEFLSTDLPLVNGSGMGNFVAFLWRLVSYYPYLIIGAIIVPAWIRKHFIKVR